MRCKECELLNKVFNEYTMKTNFDYWLMTEMFVLLHEGKDYCDHNTLNKHSQFHIDHKKKWGLM